MITENEVCHQQISRTWSARKNIYGNPKDKDMPQTNLRNPRDIISHHENLSFVFRTIFNCQVLSQTNNNNVEKKLLH